MNVKVTLLLFVLFLASTITTVAMAISIPAQDDFSLTSTTLITPNIKFGWIVPRGDPVDDPLFSG